MENLDDNKMKISEFYKKYIYKTKKEHQKEMKEKSNQKKK